MKEIRIEGKEIMSFDDNKIFFAYNDSFLKYNEALFCVSLKDTARKDRYYIIADDNFKNVSYSTKQFLVWHEIGHILNDDLEEKNVLKSNVFTFIRKIFGIGNKMEYKADAFATKSVGKISALNSLKELIDLKGDQLSKREMETRMKRIMEGKY